MRKKTQTTDQLANGKTPKRGLWIGIAGAAALALTLPLMAGGASAAPDDRGFLIKASDTADNVGYAGTQAIASPEPSEPPITVPPEESRRHQLAAWAEWSGFTGDYSIKLTVVDSISNETVNVVDTKGYDWGGGGRAGFLLDRDLSGKPRNLTPQEYMDPNREYLITAEGRLPDGSEYRWTDKFTTKQVAVKAGVGFIFHGLATITPDGMEISNSCPYWVGCE